MIANYRDSEKKLSGMFLEVRRGTSTEQFFVLTKLVYFKHFKGTSLAKF